VSIIYEKQEKTAPSEAGTQHPSNSLGLAHLENQKSTSERVTFSTLRREQIVIRYFSCRHHVDSSGIWNTTPSTQADALLPIVNN